MNKARDHDKRRFERICLNEQVCFFTDESRHFGTIVDCSADGMHIETATPGFLSPELHILLTCRNRLLNVPFTIVRMKKLNTGKTEVGLRIRSESKKYLEFVLNRSLCLPV
jgi:hypothetical protein